SPPAGLLETSHDRSLQQTRLRSFGPSMLSTQSYRLPSTQKKLSCYPSSQTDTRDTDIDSLFRRLVGCQYPKQTREPGGKQEADSEYGGQSQATSGRGAPLLF